MKFEDFVKDIKTRVLPAYYAKGEDAFLHSKVAALVTSACGTSMPDLNKTVLDDDNFSVSKMLEACEQFPFVDEKKLVFVSNVTAKLTDNDKQQILSYLSNPKESTCLLISAIDPNNTWDFLKSKVQEIECKKPSLSLALKFVVAEAKKHNKQISEKAATTLIKACAFDLFKIKNEVHKLSTHYLEEQTLQSEYVDHLVETTNEWQVFELSEAISNKNKDKTWGMVFEMLSEKRDAAFAMIGLLSNHFRRLLYASVSPLSDSEIASLLNVKEFAITKARAQKNKFSPTSLKKIVDTCCETEFQIKSGKIGAENAIISLVVTLLET